MEQRKVVLAGEEEKGRKDPRRENMEDIRQIHRHYAVAAAAAAH